MPKKKITEESEQVQMSSAENVRRKKKEETSKEEQLESKNPDEMSEKEVEKLAEAESTTLESDIAKKKKEILEKAKKLSAKIAVEGVSSEELKEKVKVKKRTDMLLPLEEYVKTGIYLGTVAVTPTMKPFVYRRRADGLAIFNTDIIDEKLKEGIEYISKFSPEDIILVCKRQVGWRTANMFSKITGIKVFTKKYPAGILTNTALPEFVENELTIITDSWLDKNALHDTLRAKKKILLICDTNNFSKGADKIIIGNNKSEKSLGVIFYLLTRGYCKARGIEADIPDLEWWTAEEEQRYEKRPEKSDRVDAKFGV
jgi:small subunit ribosomal protein S2